MNVVCRAAGGMCARGSKRVPLKLFRSTRGDQTTEYSRGYKPGAHTNKQTNRHTNTMRDSLVFILTCLCVQEKHCLLPLAVSCVDSLLKQSIYPIIIYIKPKDKKGRKFRWELSRQTRYIR